VTSLVKRKAKISVMFLEAKNIEIVCKPPEAGQRHETESLFQPSKGTDTFLLNFQPPEL
jgi:hypothetical protein